MGTSPPCWWDGGGAWSAGDWGSPPGAPQLGAGERLLFNPISLLWHPGIPLPTELPLFTQLGGIGLQGSQIPFSPFPSENTSRNNEEIGRCHLIAPKEPAGPGAEGRGARELGATDQERLAGMLLGCWHGSAGGWPQVPPKNHFDGL